MTATSSFLPSAAFYDHPYTRPTDGDIQKFNEELQSAGAAICNTTQNETLFGMLSMLSRLAVLPNLFDLLHPLRNGVKIPDWVTPGCRQGMESVAATAVSLVPILVEMLEAIAKAEDKAVISPCPPTPATQATTPASCCFFPLNNYLIFNSLASDQEASNNAVAWALKLGNPKDVLAAKIIPKKVYTEFKERLTWEIKIALRVKSPLFVSTACVLDAYDMVVLVMEKANAGDVGVLVHQQGGVCEAEAQTLMRPVVEALRHLHSNRIVHRDLKLDNLLIQRPANQQEMEDLKWRNLLPPSVRLPNNTPSPQIVLSCVKPCRPLTPVSPVWPPPPATRFDRWRVMLSDFGAAVEVPAGVTLLRDHVGTLGYCPPEALSGPYDPFAVDLWMLGVSIYQLVFSQLPFRCSLVDPALSREHILNQELMIPPHTATGERTSHDLSDLLVKLLQKTPENRPNISELQEHPWLTMARPVPRRHKVVLKPCVNQKLRNAQNSLDRKEAIQAHQEIQIVLSDDSPPEQRVSNYPQQQLLGSQQFLAPKQPGSSRVLPEWPRVTVRSMDSASLPPTLDKPRPATQMQPEQEWWKYYVRKNVICPPESSMSTMESLPPPPQIKNFSQDERILNQPVIRQVKPILPQRARRQVAPRQQRHHLMPPEIRGTALHAGGVCPGSVTARLDRTHLQMNQLPTHRILPVNGLPISIDAPLTDRPASRCWQATTTTVSAVEVASTTSSHSATTERAGAWIRQGQKKGTQWLTGHFWPLIPLHDLRRQETWHGADKDTDVV